MQHDPRATATATVATYGQPQVVGDLSMEARSTFMVRVFTHLLGALLAFTMIEVGIFYLGWHVTITNYVMEQSWLIFLGAFMVAGWIAGRAAHTAKSRLAQYAALVGYVLAEALLFVPLLTMADRQAGGQMIASAAYVSLAGFAGLAAIAIFSRKDFSFLGAALKWGGFCALGLIIGSSIIGGFELGMMFNVGMVALAGGAILFDTQRIFREYPEDRYVGASLQLFASIALLFWYVLRIFMSRD